MAEELPTVEETQAAAKVLTGVIGRFPDGRLANWQRKEGPDTGG